MCRREEEEPGALDRRWSTDNEGMEILGGGGSMRLERRRRREEKGNLVIRKRRLKEVGGDGDDSSEPLQTCSPGEKFSFVAVAGKREGSRRRNSEVDIYPLVVPIINLVKV